VLRHCARWKEGSVALYERRCSVRGGFTSVRCGRRGRRPIGGGGGKARRPNLQPTRGSLPWNSGAGPAGTVRPRRAWRVSGRGRWAGHGERGRGMTVEKKDAVMRKLVRTRHRGRRVVASSGDHGNHRTPAATPSIRDRRRG
jgi:hypothetical protein